MCIQKFLTIRAPSQDRRTWMCPRCTLSLRDSFPSAAARRCGRCRTSGSLLGAGTWGAAGRGRWAPSLRRRGRRIRRLRHLQQKCFILRVVNNYGREASVYFFENDSLYLRIIYAFFNKFYSEGIYTHFYAKNIIASNGNLDILKCMVNTLPLGSNMACTNYN